jgi:hypothetical protein
MLILVTRYVDMCTGGTTTNHGLVELEMRGHLPWASHERTEVVVSSEHALSLI